MGYNSSLAPISLFSERAASHSAPFPSRFFRAAAMALATTMLVSACGGGGGGGGVGGGTDDIPPAPAPPENESGTEAPPETPPSAGPPPEEPPRQPDFQARAEAIASQYRSNGEFSSQWGLGGTRADRAYAHLELALGSDASAGDGVTIGIVDTGIDLNHPAFVTTTLDPDKDRTITRQLLPGASLEDGSSFSHGTAVAGVAAGGRNVGLPGSAHGVAWNANIKVFAVALGSRGPDYVYNPTDLSNYPQQNEDTLNRWFSTPLAAGVDILNLSFSLAGLIEGYSEQALRAALGDVIQTMAQAGASEKALLVWAASNSHGETCSPGSTAAECKLDGQGNLKVDATSPSVLAGLPAKISELRGHVVAVVSVGEDGEISHFSNRCGIAADWCLAAPGENIRAPYFGPGSLNDTETTVRSYRGVNGTSVAAPMVSGGLALMKQLFRGQLANTALLSRLFATADKSGRYASRSIYGQGLMDLGAATAPVGQTTLTLGSRVGDPGGSLLTSNIALGNAFGDGLAQSLAGTEIAAFDSLGAPFWYDLGSFAFAADRLPIARRLKSFMAPVPARPETGGYRTAFAPSFAKAGPGRWRLGLLETPTGTPTGHLGLARYANTFTYAGWKNLAATAFSTEGFSWRAPASGAVLSWQPSEAWAGLRAGWLMERKSLLGSSARGAFGSLSSDSAFIGFNADTSVDGWHLGANAEIGFAAVKPRSGLITDVSTLATGAFAVHATRPLSGNRLFQFSVSQPLRVERGRATLSVPVGRTQGGEVMRRSVAADIAPTGRQIDVMAHWRQPLTAEGELRLGAVWTRDPGHRSAASSDLSFMVGWRSPF